MGKRLIALFLTFGLALADPDPIFAHAFGALYNLPVPFWLYLYGAVAAIVVSFLVIGYFFKKADQKLLYPSKDLSAVGAFNFLTSSVFLTALKAFSLFLFFLTIICGFAGVDNPRLNFDMTFFWIVFMLGFTYGVAIFGNFWGIVNPWKIVVELIAKLSGKKADGLLLYPRVLSFYPALVFYFIFIWLELFGETGPRSLSVILTFYSVLTLSGVFVFGKEAWFRYCEFFSVFFRLIGKIAPFELKGRKLFLRPPVIGLLKERAEHLSLVLFILFMLSSTAFDGFRSTVQWAVLSKGVLTPGVNVFFGEDALLPSEAGRIFGLPLALLIFLYVYLMLVAFSRQITKSKFSFGELVLRFAYSLVPIAFVYNVAHYFTLILTEGQNMIRLVSDPFGKGWNLFGTAGYRTNYSVLSANFVWHFQVAVILIGHIAGVYLAHVIALTVFPSHRRAIASQLPMLILMIVYTVIGLWILSQPITSGM